MIQGNLLKEKAQGWSMEDVMGDCDHISYLERTLYWWFHSWVPPQTLCSLHISSLLPCWTCLWIQSFSPFICRYWAAGDYWCTVCPTVKVTKIQHCILQQQSPVVVYYIRSKHKYQWDSNLFSRCWPNKAVLMVHFPWSWKRNVSSKPPRSPACRAPWQG